MLFTMDSSKVSQYYGWTVVKLKKELIRRGASVSGRKEDLLLRLEAYDRNQDFKGEPVLLPEPLDPDWPNDGFHQLQMDHGIHLPKLSKEQIDGYFKYREAVDSQSMSDKLKALEKGRLMFESKTIFACSVNVQSPNVFFTGLVGAAMKKSVTYSYKLKMRKENGEVLNSHCECPAGKGPHGTCKHVAAVLLMLHEFVQGSDPGVQQSCTEMLETFHKPKKLYGGTPVKAEKLPARTKRCKMVDPRPLSFRNCEGYEDHVRNAVINYCSNTSKDLIIRYLWNKADIKIAASDHDYLKLPLAEQWVENASQCTVDQIKSIEHKTRAQADSKVWREQRLWRITASRFGEVCKLTARRNMDKLCKSFIKTTTLTNKAIIHGKQYESSAIRKFAAVSGYSVKKCGLFIYEHRPYLAATPDGVINNDMIIEVKCPYTGKDELIRPGKLFPYLKYDNGEICLKETSNYFYQIQGQMLISKRQFCFFIVYTFQDMLIQKIKYDEEYCLHSLLPKLELFYEKYLRKYIAKHL